MGINFFALTDLSSLGVGGKQVHNLDTSDQNLLLHTHVGEFRGFSVDGCSPVEERMKDI